MLIQPQQTLSICEVGSEGFCQFPRLGGRMTCPCSSLDASFGSLAPLRRSETIRVAQRWKKQIATPLNQPPVQAILTQCFTKSAKSWVVAR